MVAKSGVLPISSMFDLLRTIGELNDEQYHRLVSLVASQSFTANDATLIAFSSGFGMAKSDVRNLLAFLKFIYDRLGEMNSDDRRRSVEASEFVDRISDFAELANRDVIKTRLDELVKEQDVHAVKQKLNRLEEGFLPSLRAFSSFVDFRPNFQADMEAIDGFVPVITINITTDSPDGALKDISLNVPLHQVDELFEAVDRLRRKVSKTKEMIEEWQV